MGRGRSEGSRRGHLALRDMERHAPRPVHRAVSGHHAVLQLAGRADRSTAGASHDALAGYRAGLLQSPQLPVAPEIVMWHRNSMNSKTVFLQTYG